MVHGAPEFIDNTLRSSTSEERKFRAPLFPDFFTRITEILQRFGKKFHLPARNTLPPQAPALPVKK